MGLEAAFGVDGAEDGEGAFAEIRVAVVEEASIGMFTGRAVRTDAMKGCGRGLNRRDNRGRLEFGGAQGSTEQRFRIGIEYEHWGGRGWIKAGDLGI